LRSNLFEITRASQLSKRIFTAIGARHPTTSTFKVRCSKFELQIMLNNEHRIMTIERTTSDNPDFQALVAKLDKVLAILDGDDHAFYAQFNKTANMDTVVVCYENEKVVGCGAFRPYDTQTVEIKRMYTEPEVRGKGIATLILHELEQWAAELHYLQAILETGYKQFEAIALYQKLGYTIIQNYGQYENIDNSICMKKALITESQN
jgi:putative acetyltransferase